MYITIIDIHVYISRKTQHWKAVIRLKYLSLVDKLRFLSSIPHCYNVL